MHWRLWRNGQNVGGRSVSREVFLNLGVILGQVRIRQLPRNQWWLGSVSCSVVSDSFTIPWTVACQAPLSMGIFQARILEWVSMPFSRSSQPRDRTQVSGTGRQILYRLSHQGSPLMVGEVPQMASMISILEFQVNFPCWHHLVYCVTNLKEKTISILFVFFFRGTQENTKQEDSQYLR